MRKWFGKITPILKQKFQSSRIWLASALFVRKSTKDNFRKRFGYWFFLFIGFWPVIIGIAFEMSEHLKTSLWNIYNLAISGFSDRGNYQLDWPIVWFVALSFIWGFCFFASIISQDRETNKKFDRLQASILKAPDFNVFRDSRLHFDETLNVLKALEGNLYKIDFDKSLEDSVAIEKKLELIALAVNTTHIWTRSLASSFFHRSQINGANIMLYYPIEDIDESFKQLLYTSDNTLYVRKEHEDKLLGILVLIPELHYSESLPDEIRARPLVLPIYDSETKAYNSEKFKNADVIIPGAILAFLNETSMIGDTKDIDKYYSQLDVKTQNEIRKFFSNNGRFIRSFASFRIPHHSNENECIGILNLDSSNPYSFGEDEIFFPTFYSMIYPSLLLLSKYLMKYRQLTSK